MIDEGHDDEAPTKSEEARQYPRCDTNKPKSRINNFHEVALRRRLLARRRRLRCGVEEHEFPSPSASSSATPPSLTIPMSQEHVQFQIGKKSGEPDSADVIAVAIPAANPLAAPQVSKTALADKTIPVRNFALSPPDTTIASAGH